MFTSAKALTQVVLLSLFMVCTTLAGQDDGKPIKGRADDGKRQQGRQNAGERVKGDKREGRVSSGKASGGHDRTTNADGSKGSGSTTENSSEKTAKTSEKAANASEKASERTDQRQENQTKRIDHGIKKGYLTDDEVKQLSKQQQDLAALESSYKSDGLVTRDEAKTLRQSLDTASRCIWAQKHDTEGNQMATYRLGKNVFAKDSITAALQDPNLSKSQAKAFTSDFRKLTNLKQQLATGEMTDEQRSKAQTQYNELLNTYFVVKNP
jgi:hypothetical protein